VLKVEKIEPATAEGAGQLVGRYQMLATGMKVLKLDTATGQTWVLGDSGWRPLNTEQDTIDPSDPLGILSTSETKAARNIHKTPLAELWEDGSDGKPHPTGKWIVPPAGSPVVVWERGPDGQPRVKHQ